LLNDLFRQHIPESATRRPEETVSSKLQTVIETDFRENTASQGLLAVMELFAISIYASEASFVYIIS